MLRGRRIAFDHGDVRVGVAVSDLDSILASPLTTLKRSDKTLKRKISEILLEIEPVKIYVGRPSLLNGRDGLASSKSQEFVALLEQLTDVSIELIDERLTTISAAKNLRQAGRNAKESKNLIDMAAAVSILDFAIEMEKHRS